MAKIPRADQNVMQRGGKKAAREKSSKSGLFGMLRRLWFAQVWGVLRVWV